MAVQLQENLSRSSDCELRFDALTRQLYASDASLYEIEPMGVAFPRSAAQAAGIIRAAADLGIPIIPRGAGTGLVGGALGSGLVVDFSRYNRAITGFDAERRTVRVGPGVVLDQLNAFLRPNGLQFGPDVATSSRASLGGMIANNSSGAHVPVYGVTADHILGLELALADGSLVHLGTRDESDTRGARDKERRATLMNDATALLTRRADEIRRRLPEGLLKRRPGYAFDRYLRRPGDLTQLIAGSEGTLAAIVSAELRVIPLPRRRTLGVLFFDSVADAMQATVELLDLKAAAIEHIDRLLFDQTRGQLAFRAARDLLRLDDQPCESILLVEFFDDADDKLAALTSRRIGMRKLMLDDEARQALVWAMRKAGLTLLTSRKGPAKPVTGIEDVAVQPGQLPEFVRGLQSILGRLGLEASFYGHAAAGLLHVRPVIDMHTPEGVALLRQVADEVSALTMEFRGSLAGEHGVGIARTEYLADHLGPELMAASREIKALFDPRGVMNPGKIVPESISDFRFPISDDRECKSAIGHRQSAIDHYRIDTNLRQASDRTIHLPFAPVLGFVERDESFIANLEQCNGNGACLKNAATMCPTYIVTHEEVMSTRGRANTIRAALDGRLGPRDEALLSGELDAALRPCLACKACKTECPSNVDLAQLKAELLHARQRRTGPSLLDRAIASADSLGRIGSVMAPLANAFLRSSPGRRALQAALGIDARRTLPLYSGADQRRAMQRYIDLHDEAPGQTIVLWDDTWVRYHEPDIALSAVLVLYQAGYNVVLPQGRQCCGRPAFSRGMLDEAAELGRHNLALLQDHHADLPVVFLEPSCHSMFIDDYRQLRLPHADAVAARCLTFEQITAQAAADGRLRLKPPDSTLRVAIHAHCHAKALTDAAWMKRAAQAIPGAEVTLLDTACCGMAGAYGMLASNYDLSLQVAQPMLDKLRALPHETKIVASGTSCRHQIHDLMGVVPLHMAELLAQSLP